MRVLGIDYGEKRVGLALGDTDSKIASPWGVIANEGIERLIEVLSDKLHKEDAELIVFGLPKSMHDTASISSQREEIEEVIEALKAAGLSVETMDETLSSKLAEQQVKEMGEKGKRDDLAAANILQTWLDSRR